MKKSIVFLLVALAVAGCATAPASTAEEPNKKEIIYNEDGVPIPDWVMELDAKKKQRMQAREKEMKEYEAALAKQPKRPTPEEVNKKECKINGYDCWEVIKLVAHYPVRSNAEKTADLDAQLKKMGLSVTDAQMYRDGGSRSYTLSDGTSMWVQNSLSDRSGDVTVKLTNGTTIAYDPDGYQIKPIEEILSGK